MYLFDKLSFGMLLDNENKIHLLKNFTVFSRK